MKGKTMGRGLKTLTVSLAVGLGLTACNRDYVAGYLYATNSKASPGLLTAYSIDFQSGALSQLSGSPLPTGGNNPVTVVATPNNQFLFVLNQGTVTQPVGTVVPFAIGGDGNLTAGKALNVSTTNANSIPTAMAVDAGGKFLYVTYRYLAGSSGPGAMTTFPIAADGSLGAATATTTLGNNPVGVAIPATGGFVYVIDQENPLTVSARGVLLAYKQDITTGALTAVSSVSAGTTPSAIAEDPSGHFIYVTDSATNQLYGFLVTIGGGPQAMLASPFTTGLDPVAVTVDPRGMFVYVANFASSTVTAYAINTATGALSGTGGNITTATGPTCVTVDPALGLYLYTSNFTDNSISAEQLEPHTGALRPVQGTQFTSQAQPTCVVSVANGAHATQIVQ
jgi:6-phosphogluconolactonase